MEEEDEDLAPRMWDEVVASENEICNNLRKEAEKPDNTEEIKESVSRIV
jgi:hypothetical protein